MSEPTINLTWTTLYDASSGNLPTHASYGFTKTGSFSTESISGDYLRLTSAGSAYYTKTSSMPAVQSGKCLVVHLRARMESGHTYTTGWEFGVNGLSASQADYDRLLIAGSWSGFGNVQNSLKSQTTAQGNIAEKTLLTAGTAFDLIVIWRLSSLTSGQGTHEVWYRAVGSYDKDSAKGYRQLFKVISFTNQNTNTFKFGDFYDALGQDWSVGLIRAGWTSGSTVTSTNGKEIFGSIPDEATVAVTHSASTVNPGGTVTASASIGGDAIPTLGGSSWNGSATTVVTGSSVTVPITLSASTVAPGNTVTATTTPQTGVTPTIGGATINGTPTTIVTGVPGATATAPTIGRAPEWVDGELRFYQPTAGTNPLSGGTYAVLSAASANGPYTVADSNAYSGITWRDSEGRGAFVTSADLGLTVGSTTWYRDRITDSGGLVAEGQTAAFGGDTANALCSVTFDLGSDYASRTVVITISHACTVRGESFTREPYRVTLNGSGQGSVSLPRTAVATITDGGTGSPYAIVRYGRTTAYVVIPDLATATFASLETA